MSNHKNFRWVMLGLLWLIYAAFGIVSRALPPLITPVLADLNISYSQIGIIFGSWPLVYILVSIFTGGIIDRFGVRLALFVGAIIMAVSACLRFFATGFVDLLLIVALFGAGGPMISIGGPKTISLWFDSKDRGKALGLYMTAPWVGGLLVLSLTNSVVMPLTGDSWRLTFVVYGIITLLFGILWLILAREKKVEDGIAEVDIVAAFRRIIGLRKVQLILIIGLISFATMHGMTNWLPKILENGGLSPELAGYATSITMATGIPATLLVPGMVPVRHRSRALAVFALVTALSLILIVTTSGATSILGLVVFGFACASFMPILILMLMDSAEIGAQYMGSAGGIFFCVAEIGGFGGPTVIGFLVSLFGNFFGSVIFLALLNIIVFALALLLGKHTDNPNQQPNKG